MPREWHIRLQSSINSHIVKMGEQFVALSSAAFSRWRAEFAALVLSAHDVGAEIRVACGWLAGYRKQ